MVRLLKHTDFIATQIEHKTPGDKVEVQCFIDEFAFRHASEDQLDRMIAMILNGATRVHLT